MPNLGEGAELTWHYWIYRRYKGWRDWLSEVLPVATVWTNNIMTGTFSVTVYYLDVTSDLKVAMLFFDSRNYGWALMAFVFLFLQYVVVWLRVRDNFLMTFGEKSLRYQLMHSFLPFGLPLLSKH